MRPSLLPNAPLVPPPPPNCYELCPSSESEIYCDTMNHTIKTIRTAYPLEEQGGPGSTTPPGGEPPIVEPETISVITEPQEQFRESGIYKRTTDCENPFRSTAVGEDIELDVAMAHKRAMRPYFFQYYKKKVE